MSSSFQFKATDSAKSPPMQNNSGSEGDPQIDERKWKRMISNRESVGRSRMRKQQCLDDLLNRVTKLQTENNQMVSRIDAKTQPYQRIEGENAILQAQLDEPTERLQYLNFVLHFVEDFSGMAMDILKIPNPLLKPSQLPCPFQPQFASADMFSALIA